MNIQIERLEKWAHRIIFESELLGTFSGKTTHKFPAVSTICLWGKAGDKADAFANL
jgi:hypothetical protein